LPAERRARWRAETTERFGLAADDVAYLETRRWNYFLARDRYVSIHPTRTDAEIREEYGRDRYRALGSATVEATVTDATESIFLPAVYRVADAEAGGAPAPVGEVVSFEGLYGQLADRGDRILAAGRLEERQDGARPLLAGPAGAPDRGLLPVLPPPPRSEQSPSPPARTPRAP